MAEIGVRNQKPFDPVECIICTAEAEVVVEFDSGQSVDQVALCPHHLERLVDEARDWLGGEE